MKLKVGVIGCGHLGRWHVKMHTMIENSDLVGIYDINREQAEKVATEFKTAVYEEMDKLIDEAEALVIVTSTPYHHEVAKKCLAKGKHVFIEKPITTTVEEADELIKMARERKLKIQVGHIERYNPAFYAIKDIKLKPKFIETHRLAMFNPRGTDVAVVLDLMIHDIDIILNLVDSPVKQIDASGVGVVTDNIDIANVRLIFENGATANVTASRISLKKMRKFRIFQKDTYVTLDFDKGSADVFRLTEKEDDSIEGLSVGEIETVGKKVMYTTKPRIEVNALLEESKDFVAAVLNDSPVTVTGEDGRRALKVAEEIISKINEQIAAEDK